MTNLKYDLGMKLKYNLIALFFFGGLEEHGLPDLK